MKCRSDLTSIGLPIFATLALLGFAVVAQGANADFYDPATHQLTINNLIIGNAAYVDLVATVGSIVTPPSGGRKPLAEDTFTPTNQELSIAAVSLGGAPEYYNAVVQLSAIDSIGNVQGADSFDGMNLTLPAVQVLGSTLYTNVVLAVTAADVVSVGAGMPSIAQNEYSLASHRLTIPLVKYAGKFYSNVIVSVSAGMIKSVGGSQVNDAIVSAFGGSDGSTPLFAGLVQGNDGNLYGTTSEGGAHGAGTAFKLTTSGVYSVLYSFGASGTDGANPCSALIQGSDANFYGATLNGGANGDGTIYKITPEGSETVLYSFTAADGGATLYANALTVDSDNNLYGTTLFGGVPLNDGSIFRITAAGVYSVMYVFGNSPTDGENPNSLTLGGDNNLYGSAGFGGVNDFGTVFRITPAGVYTQLYSFSVGPSADGIAPNALTLGSDDNLYGTTVNGGAFDAGTVFKISTTGTEHVLYSFSGGVGSTPSCPGCGTGSVDGGLPYAGVMMGGDGNLYGTTNFGGAYNQGTVFKVTTNGVETVIHSFGDGGVLAGSSDGSFPEGVIQANDGNMYGSTASGGTNNGGVAFRLP